MSLVTKVSTLASRWAESTSWREWLGEGVSPHCLFRVTAVSAMAIVVSACFSYAPTSAGSVPPDAAVQVKFGEPRSLRIVSGNRQAIDVGAVSRLRGRVTALEQGRVKLTVSSATDAMGRLLAVPRGSTTDFVWDSAATIEIREASEGRGAWIVVGAIALAVLAYMLFVGVAVAHS